MRCCASPTTSIAAEPRDLERRTARDVMNAVLFREILKPLEFRRVGSVADALVIRPRR